MISALIIALSDLFRINSVASMLTSKVVIEDDVKLESMKGHGGRREIATIGKY